MAKIKSSDVTVSFKKNNKGRGGTFYKKYKDPADGKWKVKYFCKGKGKSDRVAERKAKAMCLEWQEELEMVATMARVINRVKAATANGGNPDALGDTLAEQMVKAMMGKPDTADATPVHQLSDEDLEEHFEEPDTLADQAAKQLLYSKHSAARKVNPQKGKPTISTLVEQWLRYEKSRVAIGKIGESTYADKAKNVKPFVEHANGDYFNGNVEEMLMSFRAKLDMQLAAGEIGSGWTHIGYTKATWQFIDWCYTNHKISEMPRCKKPFCERVPVDEGGKPLQLSDIHKLWSSAGDRMKCFIALALNCGMKNADIAALKGSQLKGNRLIGYRPKTGVPFNMKLWPVTVELIEKCRDNQGDDELLFVNKDGDAVKSGVISSLFKKVSTKADVIVGETKGGNPKGATFEQLRDSSIDLVDKQLFELGYDRGLLQVFQQHADPSTARYYRDKTPERLQIKKLDELTDYLGEVYGLKL